MCPSSALSAALAVAGGAEAQVVAAVLVFRILTFALQIPLGALAYLYWSHSAAGRRSIEPEGAPAS